MNIHEPREITIQTCKILNRLISYPPLKLFHAEVNLNNHESGTISNMGGNYTKSKQIK